MIEYIQLFPYTHDKKPFSVSSVKVYLCLFVYFYFYEIGFKICFYGF